MLVHELNSEELWVFDRAREWGMDAIETHVDDPATFPAEHVRNAADANNVEVVIGTALQAHNSVVSDDSAIREKGLSHLLGCIDVAARVGAKKVCGGLHSANGYFPGRGRTGDEWERSVDALRRAARHASESNITLTVEPVSR